MHTGARNDHSSRNSILILPKTRIEIYKTSFAYSGSFCWNALPRSLKIACSVSTSVSTFKSEVLQHFRTDCKLTVLNRTVFSFLMFDNPGILWVYV